MKVSSQSFKASSTKGIKTTTYKDTKGTILWSIKLTGTFTYDGRGAKCTSSNIETTCTAKNWKLSNKRSSYSGAVAKASVTAKEYTVLGICAKTVNKSLAIKCSATGQLS